MKSKDILHAMGGIDPEFVERATPGRRSSRKRKKTVWLRWVAAAACICLIVGGVFGVPRHNTGDTPVTKTPISSFIPVAHAADLMEGIIPQKVDSVKELTGGGRVLSGFAVQLLQNSMKAGENTLVSPLSLLSALGMTANGARGETLAQMEETLGMDIETLNFWMHTYLQEANREDSPLSIANSVWFKDAEGFQINESFLQTNANFYGAAAYKAPFDDGTVQEINHWVEENTDSMIPEILDQIPGNAVMYLVNALAFDAKWETPYEQNHVFSGVFTKEDGTQQEVTMMDSDERVYLEDENTTGFIKYYEGREYAFVALLPNEGMTVEEYVKSLTGEKLNTLLKNARNEAVSTQLPKFEAEYSLEMKDTLSNMGMPDAFVLGKADFSGIGSSSGGDFAISRVLHKTFISFDEAGTRAGAATAVELVLKVGPNNRVCLNRPFVYMLIDCESGLPFFVGTMMDVAG